METKCIRCGHEWDYQGKSKWYITCPECYRKIRINEKALKKLALGTAIACIALAFAIGALLMII